MYVSRIILLVTFHECQFYRRAFTRSVKHDLKNSRNNYVMNLHKVVMFVRRAKDIVCPLTDSIILVDMMRILARDNVGGGGPPPELIKFSQSAKERGKTGRLFTSAGHEMRPIARPPT